eukprot:TRINITY_DN32631_c0_g1_i1.p1 TRINITY_DN32631_c0_g1~~TRINITY_DN32631_c0_g1_i1.p1  ORF type:complete len:448 (-),score=63.61 TRINITY_DN32631_c0_g1_i1:27-1370(-)
MASSEEFDSEWNSHEQLLLQGRPSRPLSSLWKRAAGAVLALGGLVMLAVGLVRVGPRPSITKRNDDKIQLHFVHDMMDSVLNGKRTTSYNATPSAPATVSLPPSTPTIPSSLPSAPTIPSGLPGAPPLASSHSPKMSKSSFHTAASACKSGSRGPSCSEDSDCDGIEGCVRCAKSGFCTDVPGSSSSRRRRSTDSGNGAEKTSTTVAMAAEDVCVAGQDGPSCTTDSDCAGKKGCISCQRKGWSHYCSADASVPSPPPHVTPSPQPTEARRRRTKLPYYSGYMDCKGTICGTLALETGLGEGSYESDRPLVHGLWPQNNPSYGNSLCVAPGSNYARLDKMPPCMDNSRGFLVHEFQKHGTCAGVKDDGDYWDQICSLGQQPLEIMSKHLKTGGDLEKVGQALAEADFPIQKLDRKNEQIYLSACAVKQGSSYVWKLAATDDFDKVCS